MVLAQLKGLDKLLKEKNKAEKANTAPNDELGALLQAIRTVAEVAAQIVSLCISHLFRKTNVCAGRYCSAGLAG